MSKTVTLTLSDEYYTLFSAYATTDNQSLEKFMTLSTLRYIAEQEYVDECEMTEIESNQALQTSLQRALNDAKSGKGRRID